jgi:CheY-specific phosphatase CheX
LHDAVVEVLEKMFFIEATEPETTEPEANEPGAAPSVLVQLSFDGDPAGVFRLSAAPAAAVRIAADFLGEDADSVTPDHVGEVVRELANMICGSVLSRIESRATFRLAPPELLAADPPGALDTNCTVNTGSGLLSAGIAMETRECLTARSAS